MLFIPMDYTIKDGTFVGPFWAYFDDEIRYFSDLVENFYHAEYYVK